MRTIVKGGATQRRDKKQKELKTTQRKQHQTQMSTNKQETKNKNLTTKNSVVNIPSSHDSCDNMMTYLCTFQFTAVAAVPPMLVSQAAAVM